MSDVDVAIGGGGPAGVATARRLAESGCRVVLIERSRFETLRIGESLAPGVQPLLAELGVWPRFLELRPLPSYGTRSLWGDSVPQLHSHLITPWGCGWHVDRLAFDRMLANAASEAGAELCLGTTVAGCSAQAAGWELELQERRADGSNPTSRRLRAKVVVDATGRTASLATRLGAERLLLDHLVSIAAQLKGTDHHPEGYVMVETTADGWWYSAPVPDGRLMAMLMTDSDLCGRDGLGSPVVWRSRLEAAAATHARGGSGRLSWGPRVVSAVSQRLRRREHSRPWLAVGDAALAVDPISGSGVVRALRSAHAAAETVLGILEGREEIIEPYELERDAECTAYLHERAMYYGLEQRWPASPFWQRRNAAWLQPAAVPSVAAR